MTELILIRHGQADSAGDNYDQLTATGHEQAKRIGHWLSENGFTFTRALHGGLRRQLQTLEAIGGAYTATGQTLPAMEIHSAFAEFDLKVWSIIASGLRHGGRGSREPGMAEATAPHGHVEFSELLKQWNAARHANAVNKGDIFKQLTGIILAEWVAQGENFAEAESFPAFRRRVLSAMEIHSNGTGGADQRILAVTSGGPISLISGEVLGLDLKHTLGLMRRIYNTSLHHFVYDRNRWELISFNSVPHLSAAERTLV